METSAPAKLAALLETLPSEERQDIAAWLFAGSRPSPEPRFDYNRFEETLLSIGAAPFPARDDTQLSTVRLPTESHARLRDWCSSHGFTMAAVIRVLVERFLDDQSKRTRQPEGSGAVQDRSSGSRPQLTLAVARPHTGASPYAEGLLGIRDNCQA